MGRTSIDFRALGALSLAALLAAAPGCDCGGSLGSGRPCAVDLDCPPGEACAAGRCRRQTDGADSGVPPRDGGALDGELGRPDGGTLPPGECTVAPSASPFESPALELHWSSAGLPFPDLDQVIHSPVVVDFLEDGADDVIPEIVFASYGRVFANPGVLRVVSGRAPHATRMTLAGDGTGPVADDAAATPSILKDAHPAAGDLDGDGRPEIVALLQAGGAVAFRRDGSELWRVGAAELPAAELLPNGSVAIHDLDGDGSVEVAVGRAVLEGASGAVRFIGTGARGRNGQGPLSCVADVVPGSPGQELIAGQTVYSATGTILWEGAPATDGFCAVADVVRADGSSGRDGAPEVIRVAEGVLYVHAGADGALRFMRPLPSCNGASGRGGAPTVADFDGDGLMEIGVAGAYCYAVFDPACVAPLPASCRGNGLLWRTATEDNSSNVTSSTVFDFNGDGRAEVVYNDEQYFMVLDGVDGTVVFREPNPSRTRTEQPIVVDVDNDGNAEIVFSANTEASFAGDGIPGAERVPGLEIWSSSDDSWVGARIVWNQHTYHIDHVGPTGLVATPEPPSWETHNTYRLNLPLEDGLAAPDLTADTLSTDTARCGEGILHVCARIFNRGDVRVGPGLEVSFYDGDPDAGGAPIGTATSTESIPRGGSTTVCVDWVGAPLEPRRVFVRVDSADAHRECIEDNNLVDLGEVRCTTIE